MININKKTAMNKFKFSDIATISTQKKKPTDEDKFHYIGLEHLDSKSLKVTRYGADVAPKGEKLVMKKGDVLFGKRRAYQKKVAIAPFDGIFSAHGMILRPNEKVISRELFPFFISSDAFLDKAIKISVGSLSPTINNSDIKKLEFELPDIREQEKYSNALFAINDTKEAYINLIGNLDKIQKSRFIELKESSDCSQVILSDICDVVTKGTTPTTLGEQFTSDGVNFVKIESISENGEMLSEKFAHISDNCNELLKRSQLKENDILFSIAGAIGRVAIVKKDILPANTNQALAIIRLKNSEDYDIKYITYILRSSDTARQFLSLKRGVAQVNLSLQDIKNLKIDLPSIDIQNQFIRFSDQIDKSKFNLKCAITELDNLSDKIKSEIFS